MKRYLIFILPYVFNHQPTIMIYKCLIAPIINLIIKIRYFIDGLIKVGQ